MITQRIRPKHTPNDATIPRKEVTQTIQTENKPLALFTSGEHIEIVEIIERAIARHFPHKATLQEIYVELEGKGLNIAGNSLNIKKATVKLLSFYEVQFSRYVMTDTDMDEEEFLQNAVAELKKLNIPPRKLLSGKTQSFITPDQQITTRSLLVADLEPMEAIRLQEAGIGEGRLLGCGLFVPHKGIKHAKES